MKFVDTSFWIALLSEEDRHCAAAQALVRDGPGPLLTSNHVVGETWTLIRRRFGRRRAVHAIPTLTVIHVDHEDDAWRWLAFDGDFGAAGFVELRPSAGS